MSARYLKFVMVIVLFILICLGSPAVEGLNVDRQNRLQEIILKLEKMRDIEIATIRKCEAEIQKCNATIQASENIIRQAQQKGNIKAEQIAREALTKAQGAKRKNEETRNLAELNRRRVERALEYVNKGEAEPEATLEQVEYENMNAHWLKNQRQLIEQRLQEPNPFVSEAYRSLKMKTPPPLPIRKYDELQPGDVLLISPKEASLWNKIGDSSFWINLGDRLTTDLRSPASHTVLYLKEVNGKKLFLDHTLGRGSHVISEAEFLQRYEQRDALVASLAQPLKKEEADSLWSAAKELIKKEAGNLKIKSGRIVDQTGYGLYGDDNLVCSEASRWILVKAGRDIPETASPLKRLLGIHYGPANFFSDDYNFIITPLGLAIEK